jgi:hypothetical protein
MDYFIIWQRHLIFAIVKEFLAISHNRDITSLSVWKKLKNSFFQTNYQIEMIFYLWLLKVLEGVLDLNKETILFLSVKLIGPHHMNSSHKMKEDN